MMIMEQLLYLLNVWFAILVNADTWEEIEDFTKNNEGYLYKYLELKNGILSHDTITAYYGQHHKINYN